MGLTKVPFSMIEGAAINVQNYGAVCDGTTDDTAAVQAAITAAIALQGNVEIQLPGLCKITSSLLIDKNYNTATNENYLTFRGTNSQGGFTATGAVTMFSTSYADQDWSHNICFENVYFASNAGTTTYVFAGAKFIRLRFNKCFFKGIRVATTSTYFQSIYFSDCKFFQWHSALMDCLYFYDLSVVGCQFEADPTYSVGFTAYDSTAHPASSTQSARFISCLWENGLGPFVAIQNGRGVVVEGCYFESNPSATTGTTFLDFQQGDSGGGGGPLGVFVTGNAFGLSATQIADATYAPILVHSPGGFYGSGNWSNGCLYRFFNSTIGSKYASFGFGDVAVANKLQSSSSPIPSGNVFPDLMRSVRRQDYQQYLEFGLDDSGANGVVQSANLGSAAYLPMKIQQQNNAGTRTIYNIDANNNAITRITTSVPALADNQTMTFVETSATNLRIVVKGSDGTTRTANITLS